MPALTNSQYQRALGLNREVPVVNLLHGEQRIVTLQAVRANGGHADLGVVSAADLGATMHLYDGDVPDTGVDQLTPITPAPVEVDWATAVADPDLGTVQVLIPSLFAADQGLVGAEAIRVAVAVVKMDLTDEGQSVEKRLLVTSRYGSGNAYGGAAPGLPVAGLGVNFLWHVDIPEIEPVGTQPTPIQRAFGLANTVPPRVGLIGESAGDPAGTDARRADAVAQLADEVRALLNRQPAAPVGGADSADAGKVNQVRPDGTYALAIPAAAQGAVLLTLRGFAANPAGVRQGAFVDFIAAGGDFPAFVLQLTAAAPRAGFVLPAGRTLIGVYDYGVDVTVDFTENPAGTFVTDHDIGEGGVQYLIRTMEAP